MCHPPSKTCILSRLVERSPNCFAILSTAYMLGFLISKFGFAGNFCSQPRNAMILADGTVILHCSAIVAAVQCRAKQCPRKKSGKSEMRRMQDDHSYLALYRDTAVVYAPRRSPIPVEKVRTEARE